MKVKVENDGRFLPPAVRDEAISKITTCLQNIKTTQNEFVVNDTLYFRKQRNGKTTTCVMNSASYISSRFQSNLAMLPGCKGETVIDDQNIDGMIKVNYSGIGHRIRDKNKVLEVIHDYINSSELPEDRVFTLFPMFYGMYVNSSFYDISMLPEEAKDLFEEVEVSGEFRLGVEFETGNVASSFRALNKLFILFQNKQIDAGVFVTSTDKANCATRIWPVSNRNGSFQELRQRRYEGQISLPLICMGFAPDRFDRQAAFLGRTGLYTPKTTGKRDETGAYEIFLGEEGEELLRPFGILSAATQPGPLGSP